jgi:hypothetical protein
VGDTADVFAPDLHRCDVQWQGRCDKPARQEELPVLTIAYLKARGRERAVFEEEVRKYFEFQLKCVRQATQTLYAAMRSRIRPELLDYAIVPARVHPSHGTIRDHQD